MRSTKKPTKKQLRRLYEAAIEFKKAEPWEWLYDEDLICVENPADKMVGYCSVMGKAGMHFALGVFLGDEGIYGFHYLLENGDSIPHYQAIFHQDCLMCSFEDREELDKRERREIKELSLMFHGRNAWPQFRRFEIGYFPWFINQEECLFLTHALEQTVIVANQYQQGEIELDFRQGKTVLRYSEEINGQLVWQGREFKWDVLKEEFPMVEFPDELLLQRLKTANKRKGTIFEAEVCYMPMPVQEDKEDRPYFPRAFILAENKSGLIIKHSMHQDPRDDANEVLTGMATEFLENGIPQEIQVKAGKMVSILEDFCQKVGVDLRVVEELPNIEEFIEGLAEQF